MTAHRTARVCTSATAGIVLWCCHQGAEEKALVFTVGEEQVVATHAELVGLAPNWPDSNLGVIKLDSASPPHYGFLATGAEGTRENGLNSPGLMKGTLDHIVSGGLMYASPVLDPATGHRLVSPDEYQPDRYQYAGTGSAYTDPGSGRSVLFTHLERHLNNDSSRFYSTLGLSISPASGEHAWLFLGEIVTPRVSYGEWKSAIEADPNLPPGVDVGSAPFLIVAVDGVTYFYLYFNDFPQPLNSQTNVNLAVARARVSDVIGAALQGRLTPWRKYRNGAWDEVGLGGGSSSLISSPPWVYDVKYNDYLRKYLLTVVTCPNDECTLKLTASSDGLAWSSMLYVAPMLDATNNILKMYPSMVGTGSDPNTLGASFYIYARRYAWDLERFEVTRIPILLGRSATS